MKKTLLLLVLASNVLFLQAQKTAITFEVVFKKNKIGTVQAVQEKTGNKITHDLSTKTDAKVFMISVHVESEVTLMKENGTLTTGTAYRHANRGSEDVHATVKKIAEKTYQAEKNGKINRFENKTIEFCVVDLFFQEPVGLKQVFSNMYADFMPIKDLGAGRYQVITPDKKNTYYNYQNGQLITVESDTPLGKVISKRV
jgi:hypothetical protein